MLWQPNRSTRYYSFFMMNLMRIIHILEVLKYDDILE